MRRKNNNKADRKWRQKKKHAGVGNGRLISEHDNVRELLRKKILSRKEEAGSLRQESSELIDKNEQVRWPSSWLFVVIKLLK